MKRTPVIIAISVAVLAALSLIIAIKKSRLQDFWHVRGVMKVRPTTNTPTDSASLEYQLQAAGRFVREISINYPSNVDFDGVSELRGPGHVLVSFSGPDSNLVWSVTSNACFELVGFYSTNGMAMDVAHLDTQVWPPGQ